MSEIEEHPSLSTLSLFLDAEGPFAADRFESVELRADLEAHVKGCDACRLAVERLLTISVAMKDLPDLRAPASLLAGVRERIVTESLAETKDLEPIPEHSSHATVSTPPRVQGSRRERIRFSIRRWSGVLAASVVIGATVGFWYYGEDWRAHAPAEREVAKAPSLEQPASAPMKSKSVDGELAASAPFHLEAPRASAVGESRPADSLGVMQSGPGVAFEEWRSLAFGRLGPGALTETLSADRDQGSPRGENPVGVRFRFLRDSAQVEAAPGTALYSLEYVAEVAREDVAPGDAASKSGDNQLFYLQAGGEAIASRVSESLFKNGELLDPFVIKPWEDAERKLEVGGFVAPAGEADRPPGPSAIEFELEEADYLVLVARLAVREQQRSEVRRTPPVEQEVVIKSNTTADTLTGVVEQPAGSPGKKTYLADKQETEAKSQSRGAASGGAAGVPEARDLNTDAARARGTIVSDTPTPDESITADSGARDQLAPGRRRLRILLPARP
ncbi:MAG: hypothetical protein ACKVX7_09165 [Planctomycetota bacterium]